MKQLLKNTAIVAFLAISFASSSVRADHLTATQWIQPVEPGVFEARVVLPLEGGKYASIERAEVLLVGRRHRILSGETYRSNEVGQRHQIFSGATDRNGDITFRDVPPGVYALVVLSEGLVGWQAMHIVAPDRLPKESLKSKAVVAPAMVSFEMFRELIDPHDRQHYSLDELSLVDADVEALLGQVRGNEELTVKINNGGLLGTVYAATTRYRAPTPEERLQALEPSPETHLFLMHQGKVINESIADVDGRFFFRELPPGIYSLLMIGCDGIGALSFELVPNGNADGAMITTDNLRFVSQPDTQLQFAFQVIPDLPIPEPPVQSSSGGGGGAIAALGIAAFGGGGGGFEPPETNTPAASDGGD